MKQLCFAFAYLCSSLFGNLPDYESAMNMTKQGKPYQIKDYPSAILYKQSYDQFNYENSPYSIEPQIPKIIHHIWLGGPLPEKFKVNVESWKEVHPDWEHILWTDQDVDDFKMTNRRHFDRAKNYGVKSDIWRYEILYRYGGLYVDTDAYCIKRFDMFHHTTPFYAGHIAATEVASGLIGAAKGHLILKNCIEAISKKRLTISKHIDGIAAFAGPQFFTKIINKFLQNGIQRVVIYPAEFFYPMPPWHKKKIWDKGATQSSWEGYIKPNTYAVHLHAQSWLKKPQKRNIKNRPNGIR